MSSILKGASPIDVAAAAIGHTLFHDMIHALGNGEIGDVKVHETGPNGVDEGDPETQASYGRFISCYFRIYIRTLTDMSCM